jgi:hypothetical protein
MRFQVMLLFARRRLVVSIVICELSASGGFCGKISITFHEPDFTDGCFRDGWPLTLALSRSAGEG